MIGLYDILDQSIANYLGISVEEYINRVEWLLEKDFEKGQELIGGILEEKEGMQDQFMEATNDYEVQ